jgi:hypothetical protein
MARKRLSRNAPCPCGSGKKYKHCCYGKGFHYEEDDDGKIFKSIPMSDEMVGPPRRTAPEVHSKVWTKTAYLLVNSAGCLRPRSGRN